METLLLIILDLLEPQPYNLSLIHMLKYGIKPFSWYRSMANRYQLANIMYGTDGGENFMALQEHLGLDERDIFRLVKNAFQAAFITRPEKDAFMKELSEFAPLVSA